MTVTALSLSCTGLTTGLTTGLITGSSSGSPGGPWQWPLEPVPRVVRSFEPPSRPWGPGHRGVDLAARRGQPVYAAGGGRVLYAARLAGRSVIVITHGRLRTTYLPVRPSVHRGQRVPAGHRIGVVENPTDHCATMPCLHWGLVLSDGRYADPLSLLGAARVRLLPVWGVPPPGSGGDPPGRRHETDGEENPRAAPPRRTSTTEPAFRPSLAGLLTGGVFPPALLTAAATALAVVLATARRRRRQSDVNQKGGTRSHPSRSAARRANCGGGPGGRSV